MTNSYSSSSAQHVQYFKVVTVSSSLQVVTQQRLPCARSGLGVATLGGGQRTQVLPLVCTQVRVCPVGVLDRCDTFEAGRAHHIYSAAQYGMEINHQYQFRLTMCDLHASRMMVFLKFALLNYNSMQSHNVRRSPCKQAHRHNLTCASSMLARVISAFSKSLPSQVALHK